MAYFANGSEEAVFDQECSNCKYGEDACPIALVQMTYNYDACNNKTARAILNDLVKDDGTCEMKKVFSKDLKSDGSKQNKLNL